MRDDEDGSSSRAPASPEPYRRALRGATVMLVAGATVSAAVALLSRSRPVEDFHFGGLLACSGAALVSALALVVLTPRVRSWRLPVVVVAGSIAIVSVGIRFAGPDLPLGGVFYLWIVVWTSLYFPRRLAVATLLAVPVAYALVLRSLDLPAPAAVWLFMIATATMTAVVIGRLVHDVETSAEAERAARQELESAHDELRSMNRTLEARVAGQIEQLEAMGNLRRFLSPQVADAVLASAASGNAELLEPHRREIAVLFCDLRGFTHFAGGAQPEDIVDLLSDYYQAIGSVLRDHGATIGAFAGDGVMAYFNDPVPCDDPAGRAVSVALAARMPMASVMARWSANGHRLGYGVGIAFGYATLGTIGFDGRSDYTALGSVVNLAARLCGEAESGEILVDGRTRAVLPLDVASVPRVVSLKGFAAPVTAHSLRTTDLRQPEDGRATGS